MGSTRSIELRAAVVLLALGFLTSGCVTDVKAQEVYGAARDVGFTEADARYLAARAGRQLSIRQLRSLQRAAGALDKPIFEKPVGAVLEDIRTNVDSDTLAVVAWLSADSVRARMEGQSA